MSVSQNFLARFKGGLAKSSQHLHQKMRSLFKGKKTYDPILLDDLEDSLIAADFGVDFAARFRKRLEKLPTDLPQEGPSPPQGPHFFPHACSRSLQNMVYETLRPFEKPLVPSLQDTPWVCLFVGANGSGKTTTIGKLAKKWSDQGCRVGVVAGDMFRAGAVCQLKKWVEHTPARFYGPDPQRSDVAGFVFECLRDAKANKEDILLIDTAGRLPHTTPLMEEMEKIVRVIKKINPEAPHSCVLVMDSTIGQSALGHVATFQRFAPLTGIILTKLDGTSKGGILLPLAEGFAYPIHGVGLGESYEDFQDFDAKAFSVSLVE